MSVNPIQSYAAFPNSLYYTKAEVDNAIVSLSSLNFVFNNPTVSSIAINPSGVIAGGSLLSTTSISVSSINGQQIGGGSVQQNPSNSGSLSGLTLQTSTWQPLVSTPATFSWIAGKLYDVGTTLGANITTVGNTGYINYGIDLVGSQGLASGTTPAVIWSQNLQSNVNQQSATHNLRTFLKPTTTDTGSIVALAYSQVSGQVGSFQMANLATHPAVMNQLN